MNFLRMCFLSVALILGLQINVASGILGELGSISKLLKPIPIVGNVADSLPLNITSLLKLPAGLELLKCLNVNNYPTLQEEVVRYNNQQRYKTIPECCDVKNFPAIFQLTYDLFSCLNDLFVLLGGAVCDLLKLLSPLTCRQEAGKDLSNLTSVGCIFKALLGTLFGALGVPVGEIIVAILGPIEYSTGCIVSGAAQMYNQVMYKRKDTRYGNAVGPAVLGSMLLATPFLVLSCLGEPMLSLNTVACETGMQDIMERCLAKQEAEGLLPADF